MTDDSVSISLTSAVVYGVSGGFFIMLIIFLVMMSCDYDCTKGCSCPGFSCCNHRKRKKPVKTKFELNFRDLDSSKHGGSLPTLNGLPNRPAPSRKTSDSSLIQMTV